MPVEATNCQHSVGQVQHLTQSAHPLSIITSTASCIVSCFVLGILDADGSLHQHLEKPLFPATFMRGSPHHVRWSKMLSLPMCEKWHRHLRRKALQYISFHTTASAFLWNMGYRKLHAYTTCSRLLVK